MPIALALHLVVVGVVWLACTPTWSPFSFVDWRLRRFFLRFVCAAVLIEAYAIRPF